MIKTHRPGKRAIVVGLLVAAVACGSAAAAAIPALSMDVHARLAPVAGTTATGRLTGMLLVSFGGTDRFEPSENLPPATGHSELDWKLSLPALQGRMSAWLRLSATKDAAPAARTLCARCSTTASGRLSLTVAQGLQLARSGAVVVVRTASATLRGRVKASPQIVAP